MKIHAHRFKRKSIVFGCFIAVVMCVIAIIILRNNHAAYRATSQWKNYKSTQVSFSYPSNWTFRPCDSKDIDLPGSLGGAFIASHQPLLIDGSTSLACHNSAIKRIAKTPDNNICKKKILGSKLHNGVYLDVETADYVKEGKVVMGINIYDDFCRSPYSTLMFSFDLYPMDKNVGGSDILEHGEPRVPASVFYESQQYKDIKRFAESIELQ